MLSKEGAEINDIGAIRDDDHLYVIDDSEDVGSAPQGAFPHSFVVSKPVFVFLLLWFHVVEECTV